MLVRVILLALLLTGCSEPEYKVFPGDIAKANEACRDRDGLLWLQVDEKGATWVGKRRVLFTYLNVGCFDKTEHRVVVIR